MVYRTLESELYPDGRLTLPLDQLPDHPVRVMVTILGDSDEHQLSELGDYLEQLTDYEERLARGEIHWQ